ncbi:hypothetical protein J4456_02330 [Candidatus Pacearchaeota archaeon]|nr:hypothetical protein [Candidatus Pacearchaeota archaeon]
MDLQIFNDEPPRNYILGHTALSKRKESDLPSSIANYCTFVVEYSRGELETYQESYVLYWKGIRAGHGLNRDKLFNKFGAHHEYSNISVFRVPEKIKQLRTL